MLDFSLETFKKTEGQVTICTQFYFGTFGIQ